MLKFTGITRQVDKLGRIVIPMEIRNKLGLTEKDYIEIYVDDNSVVLRKYIQDCIFCGSNKNLLSYNGQLICLDCKKKISNLK